MPAAATPMQAMFACAAPTRAGVFVLGLADGGVYVGSAEDIGAAVAQHACGAGSAWIMCRGGVVRELPALCPPHVRGASWHMHETVAQMLQFGSDNVRGWEFAGCGPLNTGELDAVARISAELMDRLAQHALELAVESRNTEPHRVAAKRGTKRGAGDDVAENTYRRTHTRRV